MVKSGPQDPSKAQDVQSSTSSQYLNHAESTPLLSAGNGPSKPPSIEGSDPAESNTTSRLVDDISDESSPLLSKITSYNGGTIGLAPETISQPVKSASTASLYNNISTAHFWAFFSINLVTFTIAMFDSTIMASSHPVITSHFHASNSASWLSTAFLLTSTSFQPIFGRLSDTIGRKPPYVVTMLIFCIATLWCATAQSMTSFIAARALCGFGGGGMTAMGTIITNDLVPNEIRGTYQSYINICYGVGSALGAALGGFLADWLGWRWEFGIQVPLLAICCIVAALYIPNGLGRDSKAAKQGWEAMREFDYIGSVLLLISITALILGLNLGGNVYPWSHPLVIASLSIFSVAWPLFLYQESLHAKPIMPLSVLRYNPHRSLVISNFLATIILNTVLFNAPLWFQAVCLTTATSSGLRLTLPILTASICGTATGFLVMRTRRTKWPLVLGSGLTFAGTLVISTMPVGLPTWAYTLFLIPSNSGQGFQFPGTFLAILNVTEQNMMAVVSSTLILWRNLGMVLGVAASSLVLQNALVIFLNKWVEGPDKERIIFEVRKSVAIIPELELHYRDQVVRAYAAALNSAFVFSAVMGFVSFILLVLVKLPPLRDSKANVRHNEDESDIPQE